ncbi:RNA ligase family protein [Bradyrhizobium erythrophlei]|uniref:ATP-dependent DNA ligase n=1 Tax=Bradyrhizobium erythrophlei TaxID=1437360 RepID=UPI0009A62799|nr:RNA ligase family protein [Bradyrhizobium erythrophlei]
MPKALFEPCLPTRGKEVPSGADWLHEIKYDGYRLIVQRDGDRVRLFTKNGHDWTKRYPWIVEAALKNPAKRFVLDGEAVVLGVDGVSDFDSLHSRKYDDQAQLYAFDMLATDEDDVRKLPLSMRKTKLARLLDRRPDGIFAAPFEPGPIDPRMFPKACEMGLEGMVSKRLDSPYRPGPQRSWVKVKNPLHPALYRVKDSFS